jgi:hypothetical protein
MPESDQRQLPASLAGGGQALELDQQRRQQQQLQEQFHLTIKAQHPMTP